MEPVDRLLSRLDETEHRFHERRETRESATRSIREGDFVGANPTEALRSRLSHLNADPELTERLGTRSFAMPEHAEAAGTRAIIENVALERILGSNDLMPTTYLALGLQRARSVARVHIRDASGRSGYGTGFLVSPRLLLTNNHVLESARDAADSQVEFDFEVDLTGNVRQTVFFNLDPRALFVTDRDLDFTLVAVRPTGGREPQEWGWIVMSEEDGLIVKGEYVSIVQHPNGEAKQLALRENKVIDLLDEFAHYQTDTAPGSSGSPVFNDQWELVALHHSGVPEKDSDGDIVAVDGRKWKRWMGDHRIKWIANEGVSGKRIVDFIKAATGLSPAQRRLRDELFDGPPPTPDTPTPRPTRKQNELGGDGKGAIPVISAGPPPTAGGVTWTVPLQVTISVGSPQLGVGTAAQGPAPPGPPPIKQPPIDEDELQDALAEVEAARRRPYFDEDQDRQDRDEYYADIDLNHLSTEEVFHKLHELLRSTHIERLSYKPSRHVYPWVDLHPDRKLRSVYSGVMFEPEELIREDFRIEQERSLMLQELMQRESVLTAEQMHEQVDLLESRNPFNCEHVVPQSWYNKKEPMRGDLHHLFTCESGCNSFRGNLAYFDFTDFDASDLLEADRTNCGRREGDDRFEPATGKGVVARATLYFLLRYPGKVDSSDEFPADRIATLLQWHDDHPVTDYERHRNQAIFDKQGNRNPLIDRPDWANKIRFQLALW